MADEIENCLICGNGLNDSKYDFHKTFIDCKLCGKYYITEELINILLNNVINNYLKSESSYIISSVLREKNVLGYKDITIGDNNIHDFFDSHLVPDLRNPIEKLQKIILRTKDKSKEFGYVVHYRSEFDYSLAYAKNSNEFIAIIKLMVEEGYATANANSSSIIEVILTLKGWTTGTDLENKTSDSIQAFIAIWFNDSMNESIKAIEDAVVENGYKPMCIRNEHFKEKIMDKAINEIKKSKFLIVDLTGDRNSVFFEAGLAHGLGLEAIYIYKKSDKEMSSSLEFYVKHYQCYEYIDGKDLKNQLINIIGARIS